MCYGADRTRALSCVSWGSESFFLLNCLAHSCGEFPSGYSWMNFKWLSKKTLVLLRCRNVKSVAEYCEIPHGPQRAIFL